MEEDDADVIRDAIENMLLVRAIFNALVAPGTVVVDDTQISIQLRPVRRISRYFKLARILTKIHKP